MVKLRRDEGFTGLEAAIVLISFVVVASVFSFVVLGAGFFTTQKSQEVVHSSTQMASSSLEIIGNVYGNSTGVKDANNNAYIDGIRFVVGLTAGGNSVDLSQTTITYSNSSDIKVIQPDVTINSTGRNPITNFNSIPSTPFKWYIIDIANNGSQPASCLLENNEQYTLYVKLDSSSIGKNERFTIELRPPMGASYAIVRKAPARIKAVNILY